MEIYINKNVASFINVNNEPKDALENFNDCQYVFYAFFNIESKNELIFLTSFYIKQKLKENKIKSQIYNDK